MRTTGAVGQSVLAVRLVAYKPFVPALTLMLKRWHNSLKGNACAAAR
ncbi:uncharacterized membrane protein YhaH (DUF805 family) [Paraburkholderia sp. MM5496-R1]